MDDVVLAARRANRVVLVHISVSEDVGPLDERVRPLDVRFEVIGDDDVADKKTIVAWVKEVTSLVADGETVEARAAERHATKLLRELGVEPPIPARIDVEVGS